MLQEIREWTKGWLAWAIISVIAFVFVAWGVADYLVGNPATEAVAKVNGQKIEAITLEHAFERLSRAQQKAVEEGDLSEPLNREKLKQEALQSLIKESILSQNIKKQGFAVDEQQLNQALLNVPEFTINGEFSQARFQNIASAMYYTPQGLKDLFRDYFLQNQLNQGLLGSSFILTEELEWYIELLAQTRDFQYLIIPMKDPGTIAVREEEIQQYYDAHHNQFMTSEKVQIEYIELKSEDLKKGFKIDEQDIESYYHQHINEFQIPESRELSHIFIALPSNPSEQDIKDAEQKLNTYRDEILNGASFSTHAEEYSQDPLSANKGGNLGWFTEDLSDEQKNIFDNRFIKAAFDLKKVDAISEPVVSRYGVHLIKLEAIKPLHQAALSEVSDEIKNRLEQEKLADLMNNEIEQLETITYETPDSLKPAAEALHLPIHTSPLFGREGTAEGFTSSQRVVQMAFSDEVLLDRVNSSVMLLDNDNVAVIRVKDYKPARLKSLQEVSHHVKHIIQREEAAVATKVQGQKYLDELQSKEINPSTISSQTQQEWHNLENVTRSTVPKDLNNTAITDIAFSAPKPQKDRPVRYVGQSLASGEYVLLGVTDVKQGTVKQNEERQNYADMLKQVSATYEREMYHLSLEEAAEVNIYEKRIR